MKKTLIFLSIFLLGSCNVYALQKNNYDNRVNVYNTSTVNNIHNDIKYVDLVIDYSGSMVSWIEEVKKAVLTITSKLSKEIQIGVRTFGEKQTEIKQRTYRQINPDKIVVSVKTIKPKSSCSATTQVLPITQNSTSTIVESLNNIKIGGSTPITLGLRNAVFIDFAQIDTNNQKKIILITDGNETCGGNPCSFIRNIIKTRKDFVIDVVHIGKGKSNLYCLPKMTNGTFYHIKDINNIENVIHDSITNSKKIETNSSYGYVFMDN